MFELVGGTCGRSAGGGAGGAGGGDGCVGGRDFLLGDCVVSVWLVQGMSFLSA